MKFSKEFLLDRLGDTDTVHREMIGKGRWTVDYREVFKYEGKFYATTYGVGSGDEGQRPYEYDADQIECPEVVAVERCVTIWEAA